MTDVKQEVEGVRTWYNLVASDFQRRYEGLEGEYWYEFEDSLYDLFVSCKDKSVLDLGTGGGRYAFRVANSAKEVYGIDISEEMVRIANEKKGDAQPHLHFEVGNATQLRFSDSQFDVVVSVGMFEYLQDPAPFLKEIHRVLRQGGEFAFSCYGAPSTNILGRLYKSLLHRLLSDRGYSKTSYQQFSNVKETLYSPAHRDIRVLKRMLESAGFKSIDYRTTLFLTPSLVFRWAGVRQFAGLKMLAAQLNRWAGWCFLTKWVGKILIVKCVKN